MFRKSELDCKAVGRIMKTTTKLFLLSILIPAAAVVEREELENWDTYTLRAISAGNLTPA